MIAILMKALVRHKSLLGRTMAACLLLLASPLAVLPVAAQVQLPTQSSASADAGLPAGSPIRLRQPQLDIGAAAQQPAPIAAPNQPAVQAPGTSGGPLAGPSPLPPPRPSEFESFVGLQRFGADLISELAITSNDFNPSVPADYLLQTGDEISVSIWGSVDADLRLTVDRSGRVAIPRVGSVLLAGVRYGELEATLTQRVARVFKNFELSASLGRLRGVRVFVTGFVQRPGAYVVGSLSTVMSAVMKAGGPSSAGSYRQIELRRGGKTTATLDLYDLILRGDRSGDLPVQPDDVVYVSPTGTQVGLKGSANRQAVYELRAGETLGDLLRMAGGFSPVGDRSRVALERLDARNSSRIIELPLPDSERTSLSSGDVVRVFSAVDVALSVERQNRRIKVEGEVARPGEYLLAPGSTLADALRAAGGLTKSAYLYGTQFTRESVRQAQVENYDRALRDLETDLVRNSASKRVSTAEEGAGSAAQTAATSRLIERLRALQPTGRIVLQTAPDASELPDLLLEDQDRLYIPARPTSIGVFGSVFNAGNYLFMPGRQLNDYLRLAGGPTKGADENSIFVVRSNGQVVSSRQNAGWLMRGNQIASLTSEPGDTVYVPEEMDKTTLLQNARDWTLLLFQLGVGAAGIKSALN